MQTELHRLVAQYHEAQAALDAYTAQHWPPGSVVWIDADAFKGIGILTACDAGTHTMAYALLESQNIWCYPWTSIVSRVPVAQWPTWVRQFKLPGAIITGRPRN